ncbi:NUDIX domain-containing protein [Amycolatopsis acidiphila]|uniref:NUDIX domain-containing protein n=1 Tax=Amycolatopsis acidiphila TaxID=715473 RepID=A0A558ANV5_9PSEU|nr:NUDIX domain-containing protein [Amycolatopsis acidiphila]
MVGESTVEETSDCLGVSVDIVVHELVENGFAARDVPEFGLPETDYGKALDHLVQANVDVIVHTAEQNVLLGYRQELPLRGMLWAFGGRMKLGESVTDAAGRALARELGFKNADPARFALDNIYNVIWGSRSIPPEERGFQTLLILMRYECTEPEIPNLNAADETHEWVRWYTPAQIRELHVTGSWLIHPFLPVVLKNAGLL